ncbi:hypothetical protein ACFE04_019633 [Oxalis oulophora]
MCITHCWKPCISCASSELDRRSSFDGTDFTCSVRSGPSYKGSLYPYLVSIARSQKSISSALLEKTAHRASIIDEIHLTLTISRYQKVSSLLREKEELSFPARLCLSPEVKLAYDWRLLKEKKRKGGAKKGLLPILNKGLERRQQLRTREKTATGTDPSIQSFVSPVECSFSGSSLKPRVRTSPLPLVQSFYCENLSSESLSLPADSTRAIKATDSRTAKTELIPIPRPGATISQHISTNETSLYLINRQGSPVRTYPAQSKTRRSYCGGCRKIVFLVRTGCYIDRAKLVYLNARKSLEWFSSNFGSGSESRDESFAQSLAVRQGKAISETDTRKITSGPIPLAVDRAGST